MSLEMERRLERVPIVIWGIWIIPLCWLSFIIYGCTLKSFYFSIQVTLLLYLGMSGLRRDIIEKNIKKRMYDYENLVEMVYGHIMEYLSPIPTYFQFIEINELKVDEANKYLKEFRDKLYEYNKWYWEDEWDVQEKVFATATLLICSMVKYPKMKPKGSKYNDVSVIFLEKVLENFMSVFEGLGIKKKENIDPLLKWKLSVAFDLKPAKVEDYIYDVINEAYVIVIESKE